MNWHELAERLIPYAKGMGFTHLEFMPIAEHPFGGSWGYQPLGQFAPSARFGTPEQFAEFVNRAHEAGLGIILDWVPAHFPNDAHGLVQFDGTPLYEHADPREGYHQDWNTMIYNLGRNEVSAFLIASGLAWLKRYHVDGLRVDAVASMLYRDYSRKAGEWVPNIYGGRENLESIAFLKRLNHEVRQIRGRDHDRRGIDGLAGRDGDRWRTVGLASTSSGTWAGCTTRCTTWKRTRFIVSTITTCTRSAWCTRIPSASCCRCRTMKWCMARDR